MAEEQLSFLPPGYKLPPGITEEQVIEDAIKFRDAAIEEFTRRPPTIGVVGVSGVGKSSTINKFFKTDLPVSDIVACTKEFRTVDLQLQPIQRENIAALPIPGEIFNVPVHLRVVDAPGLGEDAAHDPGYLKMYHEHLPECDAILWIIAARNRAMALDQQYLREFAEFYPRMAFGMNQVDLLEPMDWNHKINLPTGEFDEVIRAATADRKKKLEDIVQKPVNLVPYSSKYGYNLNDLFTEFLNASNDRGWVFGIIKAFDWKDFIPKHLLGRLEEELRREEARKAKFRKWFGFLQSPAKKGGRV